jgi:hypothetical protein
VYEAVGPANSEATLHLPAASADAAREGGAPLARVDGVRFLGHTQGVSSYRLPSGRAGQRGSRMTATPPGGTVTTPATGVPVSSSTPSAATSAPLPPWSMRKR